MWIVINGSEEKEFDELDPAMRYATKLGTFVTIRGKDFEFVGKFGVDEVRDPEYNGWISRKKERAQIAQSVEAPVSKAV